MNTIIKLENITKSYQLGLHSLQVLKGIDLEILEGDFLSIMGQSGSGKSTLMNIIGMLDNPTSGKYFFNGTDVSSYDIDEQAIIRRKHIGFIFQNYNLLKRTKVIEQVMLPLMYQGVSIKLRTQQAIQALEKVGLADKLDSYPNELSGGQQQRVAIARAIVTNPSFILGDEPTGALDTQTGEEVMEILSNLNKEGKTILIITHSPEVDKHATKHILIKDGIII